MPDLSRCCRVAFFGEVPVQLLADMVEVFLKAYPKAVALNSGHWLSREHGATLMAVRRDDPVLGKGTEGTEGTKGTGEEEPTTTEHTEDTEWGKRWE